ncbi:hypothetical protein CTI14_34425 [Methylobacterium radiotolerans]|nr:hypothetical protein CTI14_34425 [Methylobacterium radiotolerans]
MRLRSTMNSALTAWYVWGLRSPTCRSNPRSTKRRTQYASALGLLRAYLAASGMGHGPGHERREQPRAGEVQQDPAGFRIQ